MARYRSKNVTSYEPNIWYTYFAKLVVALITTAAPHLMRSGLCVASREDGRYKGILSVILNWTCSDGRSRRKYMEFNSCYMIYKKLKWICA